MTTGSALPHAAYRRFASFREYEALTDALIEQTQTFIRVFERALPVAWNTPARNTLLREFLRRNPANRLWIVVHETEGIERRLPRLLDLQRDFGHAFKIRQTPKMAHHLYDPFVIFDASHYLHRFHHAHMRAVQGIHDVEGASQLLDRHAELWEASAPVSPAAPGGL